MRGPYPEAEDWLVVLLLLPPEDDELLTEIMEWGRLLLRESSPDDTVIELRNRGAAAPTSNIQVTTQQSISTNTPIDFVHRLTEV